MSGLFRVSLHMTMLQNAIIYQHREKDLNIVE